MRENCNAVPHSGAEWRSLEVRCSVLLRIVSRFEPYSNLGVVTFFTGHYQESARMFQKATELEPQSYIYRGNLADAYRWTPGEKDRAGPSYAEAIVLAES
jgi:hypothetical protein